MIKNKAAEEEIMKDVPHWIPGTFYGSPIYHNTELWKDGDQHEYYAHIPYRKASRMFREYLFHQTRKHLKVFYECGLHRNTEETQQCVDVNQLCFPHRLS